MFILVEILHLWKICLYISNESSISVTGHAFSPEAASSYHVCKRCLIFLSCIAPLKSGRDEPPLAISARHTSDKQLIPIEERSWLHVVLIGLDHVRELKALQARHLTTCITTLLRHRFHGLLHLQCFENLSLSSWNISLRALTSEIRTVASSLNSSSEITGRPSVPCSINTRDRRKKLRYHLRMTMMGIFSWDKCDNIQQ